MRTLIRRKKRTFIAAVAAVLLTGAALAGQAGTTAAQGGLWFVVINLHTSPPTIGVAPGSWSQNGWLQQAGPFQNARQAWDVACRMHATKRYFSPDIADLKVGC